MKAKTILFLSVIIPFALIFLYVWTTATDLVFRDDMYMIKGGFIESYLRGTLTFADLWRPSDSTRILGGALLHIATIKWFSMNSWLLALLAPFLMLFSALLIYRDYRKSLTPENSPEFVSATFLLLTFMIFNISQWENVLFANGIGVIFPVPFIMASFISLELFLSKGSFKYFLLTLILTPLALLVFGGKLCFVFVPTLGITFLCYLWTRRPLLAKSFRHRALWTGFLLILIAFIYIYRIDYNDYVQKSPHFAGSILTVLSHPSEALQFLLAAFGAGVVGVDVFFISDYFSFSAIVFIGLLIVMLYAVALFLYFKSRMYEKTYLPFFLITQTFFFLIFMTVGRFGLGNIDYGMSSRYTSISLYGLVAMVWIFIFMLARSERPDILLKGVIYAGCTVIFAGLLLTTVVEWGIQPIRKAYFEQLREVALRVDTATPEELSRFAERPELTRDSLRLLRDYKMNVYRTKPAGGK